MGKKYVNKTIFTFFSFSTTKELTTIKCFKQNETSQYTQAIETIKNKWKYGKYEKIRENIKTTGIAIWNDIMEKNMKKY